MTEGNIDIKSFLSKDLMKTIVKIIFENFRIPLELDSLEKFDVEDQTFHDKLIQLRKLDPKKFGEIYDKIQLSASFRGIFMDRTILDLFSTALDVKPDDLYLNGFMLRLDPPFDNRNSLNWHQDAPYYMMNYPNFNSGVCWMSITKTSKENGALIYVPRSHSQFLEFEYSKADENSSIQRNIRMNEKEIEQSKILNQEFGDATLLHMKIKHRSGDNISSKVRITMGCRFHDMSSSFNFGKEEYRFKESKFNKL